MTGPKDIGAGNRQMQKSLYLELINLVEVLVFVSVCQDPGEKYYRSFSMIVVIQTVAMYLRSA